MPDVAGMDSGRLALLAAGGTGGHLFPAEALAIALSARGWRIQLATDHRVDSYGDDFPAEAVHMIRSATVTGSLTQIAGAAFRLGAGLVQSWRLVRRLRPNVAVGFGGYPTLPPILAAVRAGIPTIVHDQNAVLGRANRFLAARVDFVATSVAGVKGAEAASDRVVETGNPVRPAVGEAAKVAYPDRAPGDTFRLLVFGGSQGARFLSELLPAAIAELPDALRRRVTIVQQSRGEDLDLVKDAYQALGVGAELHQFFDDLPRRMAECHLVISRSGASTCAELTVIGRPAIMVPLPGALDQDQAENASRIDEAGGGWMVAQSEMTPQRLAAMLTEFVAAPAKLSGAAGRARALARADGAERLADLVERAASGRHRDGPRQVAA